jgi:hypothetical protein
MAAAPIQPCADCQAGAYSGTWPPPERVAVHPDGPTFLHQCERCGTYWDFRLRAAVPIAEEEARQLYPALFSD